MNESARPGLSLAHPQTWVCHCALADDSACPLSAVGLSGICLLGSGGVAAAACESHGVRFGFDGVGFPPYDWTLMAGQSPGLPETFVRALLSPTRAVLQLRRIARMERSSRQQLHPVASPHHTTPRNLAEFDPNPTEFNPKPWRIQPETLQNST